MCRKIPKQCLEKHYRDKCLYQKRKKKSKINDLRKEGNNRDKSINQYLEDRTQKRKSMKLKSLFLKNINKIEKTY